MSYSETVRTKTERGRLYELGLHQSEVTKLDLKIRKRLPQLKSVPKSNAVVSREIKQIDEMYQEYMSENSRCLDFIKGTDDHYSRFTSGLCVDKLGKGIQDFKRKFHEQSEKLEEAEPSETASRLQANKKSASINSKRTNSSIKEASLRERANLAELKLEASYMQIQEEAIQKQKMLAKQLEIAKAEARLKVYEEEDEEIGSRRSSNFATSKIQKRDSRRLLIESSSV